MRILKGKNKKDLLVEINNGFEDREIYIPRIFGAEIVVSLIENCPNLKVLYVPPSIYEITSERVKLILQRARISLQSYKKEVGRPNFYTNEDIRRIIELKNNGIAVTEISKILGIPRRTIYYLLNEKKEY